VTFLRPGELYIFRITNKSDADTYSNAFVFTISPEQYSATDFDLQLKSPNLRELEQQSSNNRLRFSDVFGIFGAELPSILYNLLVLYIYHLGPHESHEVTLRFTGLGTATTARATVSSEVMSYSSRAIPIAKTGDLVSIPVLVKLTLVVDRLMSGLMDESGSPCSSHPVMPKSTLQEGCYYLGFRTGNQLPQHTDVVRGCDP
jgi:hypothetical protein